MRVTNQMIMSNMIKNISRNAERLQKIIEYTESYKKINRPSDDPMGMIKVMDYRTTLSKIEQYSENIEQADFWLRFNESTLTGFYEVVAEAKKIAISQSSEMADAETRSINADEIESIFDQLISLANSKLGGRYIFGGYKTDTPPFSRDGNYQASYHGDDGKMNATVGEGVSLETNITGDEIFMGSAGGVNIFDVLQDLRDGLDSDDTNVISNQVSLLGDAMQQILVGNSEIGSKVNRLEIAENHLNNFEMDITNLLSETEDADIAKTIIELKAQQTVYETVLQTTAMISQLSLINFM